MKSDTIVVMHYHLMPGGVTDVIAEGIVAMLKHGFKEREFVLITGRRENAQETVARIVNHAGGGSVRFEVVPEIDYRVEDGEYKTLKTFLLSRYGGDKTVWWIHNHHLCKNVTFTDALLSIANEGKQSLLFQIHDFPECARPGALESLTQRLIHSPYPVNNNIRYIVINHRDERYLKEAGMPENSVFFLGNPIDTSPQGKASEKILDKIEERWGEDFPGLRGDAALALYPVRGIRRKNILESGYINLLHDQPWNIFVTLPGISDAEKAYSGVLNQAFREGWIDGAYGIGRKLGEVGVSFEALCSGSDLIISTSALEGFGYLYFNAMLLGKPLIARHLDILNGFDDLFEGYPVCFYTSLNVPLLKSEYDNVKEEYRRHFILQPPDIQKILEKELKELKGEAFDFSFLSVALQCSILRRLAEDKEYLRECRELNASVVNEIDSTLRRPSASRTKELDDYLGYAAYAQRVEEILSSSSPEGVVTESVSGKLVESFATLALHRLLFSF